MPRPSQGLRRLRRSLPARIEGRGYRVTEHGFETFGADDTFSRAARGVAPAVRAITVANEHDA